MLSLNLLFCYTLTILIVLQGFTVAYPHKIFRYNPKEAGAFEGDIILPSNTRGVGEAAQAARWTNGIVPYVIKSGDFNTEQEAVIVKTMRRLEQIVAINNKLCIQFRPKTSTDEYFTTIKTGAGCTSSVGQNWYGTKELTLGNGCINEGIIMHELLHTLGFWHEQSRPDRDNYVIVQYANVQPGLEHAFNKYTTSVDTLGTPYDYESLMHYGSHDFSSNGKPTIVPKQPTAKIGQGQSLSRIDILEVQLYYQCTGSVSDINNIVSGAGYKLVNINSNKVLDVYRNGVADGANVQIYTDNDGKNQCWIIHKNQDGTVKLIDSNSGKALDVHQGGASDGINVQIWSNNESNAQKWRPVKVGNEYYKLINVASNKALDVYGSRTNDETNVQSWSDNGTPAQQWRFVRCNSRQEK